jgi:hypothetical protein
MRKTDYHINIFFSEVNGGHNADIPDLEACSAFGKSPRKLSNGSRSQKPLG